MTPEFISEPITPDAGTFNATAMAAGQPGLPSGFTWRDRHYAITAILSEWKYSEAYNHAPGGDRYYRKHYWKVRVDTGEVMTLYAVRHMKPGESAKRRWWLFEILNDEGAQGDKM